MTRNVVVQAVSLKISQRGKRLNFFKVPVRITDKTEPILEDVTGHLFEDKRAKDIMEGYSSKPKRQEPG